MPIFQDDIHHVSPAIGPIAIEPAVLRSRRLSEESLRTELCEGPVPESPMHPSTPKGDGEAGISDRAELIQRLKRGESPTWVPNRHLESILQQDKSHNSQEQGRTSTESPNLLPAAPITPDKTRLPESADTRLRDGLSIERPRSAFHSGDFTSDRTASESDQHRDSVRESGQEPVSTGHVWFATSPPRHFTPFPYGVGAHGGRAQLLESNAVNNIRCDTSLLSTSLSSFVYQPPTSPLAQSETNEDVDFSTLSEFPSIIYESPRRHQLNSTHSSPFRSPSSISRLQSRLPLRREGCLPYQAHQPRRSLTSAPSFLHHHHFSSPQTPALLRSRRQSLGLETSPIQHASMVGSYEESILRGRMSTTPSKPFEFLAQIGVMGKGNCKSSLQCPRHVTLPFPAVYYSYGGASHGRSPLDDGPSPYVGQIDLENGLPNPEEELRSRRKAQRRFSDRKQQVSSEAAGLDVQDTEADRERRKAVKSKRTSASSRAPPGGSYRIPETGQIQIVIKNPNKTAVKLFLVPYDLTGMTPGTKTFIRQRSYSLGPIIHNVPPNSPQADANRPILRYLLHLHICSPSKGRFYLYRNIRIVFANRVPDDKEKLRNETTWPEPRFSPYRPIRVMNPPLSTFGGAGATLASEKALRRRSMGILMGGSMSTFDGMDGLVFPEGIPMTAPSTSFGHANIALVEPIPLRLPQLDAAGNDSNSDSGSMVAECGALDDLPCLASSCSSTKDPGGVGGWGSSQYEKLNRGDAGYGGNAFGHSSAGSSPGNAPEGLLSQRLRCLGVKPQQAG